MLPQILPLFPKKIDKFVDLFGGGGEVSLNVNAKQVVYNDKCKPLVNIFRNLDSKFVDEVKEMIDTYKLNKFSKQEFLNLRSYYNTNLKDNLDRENAVVLYCLITHAFKIDYLIKDYNNCNYHTKVKTGNSSTEVLITNY